MKNKVDQKKLPWKVSIIIIFGVIGTLIAGALGMINIRNYYYSILFVSITTGLGVATGILSGIKYKRILTAKPGANFIGIVLYLCMFFSTVFLFLASTLNRQLSKKEVVADCVVLYKYHQESHRRSEEINYVLVNIGGEEHKLSCRRDYEIGAKVGQKVIVNVYKSPLGFDFAEPAGHN